MWGHQQLWQSNKDSVITAHVEISITYRNVYKILFSLSYSYREPYYNLRSQTFLNQIYIFLNAIRENAICPADHTPQFTQQIEFARRETIYIVE